MHKSCSLRGGRVLGLVHLRSDQLVSLLDSHAEVFVVLQNVVDFWDVQVDEHASDFRGLAALQRVDEAEDGSANLLLVVGVLLDNTLDKRSAAHEISLLHARGLLRLLHRLLEAWHAAHLVWHLLWHLLHGLLDAAHVHWSLVLSTLNRTALGASVAVVVGSGSATDVLARLALVLHSVIVVKSWRALLVALWGQFLEDLLDHFNQNFRLVMILEGRRATVLLAEFDEVDFVLVFLVMELSDFLDLVMVDLELAAHELG